MKDGKKGAHVVNVCAFDCSVYNIVNPNSTLCQAHDKVYIGVTMVWEQCVCPMLEVQKWHKLECLWEIMGSVEHTFCMSVLTNHCLLLIG
jgi:hypothetical protein